MNLALATDILKNDPISWDEQFLNWFADQNIPMCEKKLCLGSVEYFHFSSIFNVLDGRRSASFGSHPNRRIAAIKCAAEAVERIIMVEYFTTRAAMCPRALRTSNGWAVHSSKATAQENALREAIERHLLLKSYCLHGWKGFRLIESVDSNEVTLKFLVARYKAHGLAAGMVMAQSPKFKGISLGYTAGPVHNIDQADFWQGALFEAVDKLLVLDSAPQAEESEPWIRRENNRLLAEYFDPSAVAFSTDNSFIETGIGKYSLETIDLGEKNGLNFPLFAAFASGGNLIPLFWKSELDNTAQAQVLGVLNRNGIFAIPERHPIV